MGKSTINGSSSIIMLNYQRVLLNATVLSCYENVISRYLHLENDDQPPEFGSLFRSNAIQCQPVGLLHIGRIGLCKYIMSTVESLDK